MYKKASSKSGNEELLLSLEELLDDPDSIGDETRDWTMLASRGGLVQVNDSTFEVFHATEVVRQYFQKDRAKEISGGMKEAICDKIITNEHVISKWNVVAVDRIQEVGKELLKMLHA